MLFLRRIFFMPNVRFFSLSAPEVPGAGTMTGIEHALQQQKHGDKNKQNFKDYKCIDYLNYNSLSFYNKEVDIRPYRVPQPSNKRPDIEPKFKL